MFSRSSGNTPQLPGAPEVAYEYRLALDLDQVRHSPDFTTNPSHGGDDPLAGKACYRQVKIGIGPDVAAGEGAKDVDLGGALFAQDGRGLGRECRGWNRARALRRIVAEAAWAGTLIAMSIINSTKAAEPVGPYPHARRVGNLLFLSGVGPRKRGSKDIPGVTLDAAGNIISYDIETQMRSCFENVRLVLEEAGSSLDKIVDVTSFLTNMQKDFGTYNRVYAEFFPAGSSQPARTTVEIGALPTPIAFEVKVIATV
jgi:2-aminomuconate deaminase